MIGEDRDLPLFIVSFHMSAIKLHQVSSSSKVQNIRRKTGRTTDKKQIYRGLGLQGVELWIQ